MKTRSGRTTKKSNGPKKIKKPALKSAKNGKTKISVHDKTKANYKQLDGRLIDGALSKITPQLQSAIDAIIKRVEGSPLVLQDLQALGLRVLKHASEISEVIKKKVSK